MCIFSAFSIFFSALIWGTETVGTASSIRFLQTFSSIGTFLAPALLFGFLMTRSWVSYARANVGFTAKQFGIVLVLSVVLLPIVVFLTYLNELIVLPESWAMTAWMVKMEENANQVLELLTADGSVQTLLVNIVFLAVVPALCEEFLFRGTLQPFFTKWFRNKHVAIIVTAFIFSAIHFQFAGFIPRFVLGIYLGYLLVWSGSLWLPVVAHLLHNSFSLIVNFASIEFGFSLEETANIFFCLDFITF